MRIALISPPTGALVNADMRDEQLREIALLVLLIAVASEPGPAGSQLSAKVSAPSMCEEWGSSGRGCLRSREKPASINGESRGKTTESNSRSARRSLFQSIPSAQAGAPGWRGFKSGYAVFCPAVLQFFRL